MPNGQFTEISFYIVAHADDWQLFMQPNAYKDILSSTGKVIVIITTAGDAAAGEYYWQAREEGTKSSIRFCLAPYQKLTETSGWREFDNHSVYYWSSNNTTCYFLRLPDGNLDGEGFQIHDYASLTKLKEKKIRTLYAIDHSSKYESWDYLSAILQKIILFESIGLSNIWINFLNPDISANPNDHADHIATGHALHNTEVIHGLRQVLFIGYSMKNTSGIMQQTDLFWKTGMFAAYEKAVFDISGYSTLHENPELYLDWCLKPAKFRVR